MYNPIAIDCKTVIVTEEQMCPIPVVIYPDTPEIWFDGDTAYCKISISSGNYIDKLDAASSSILVFDGMSDIEVKGQMYMGGTNQTTILSWKMQMSTDYCMCKANIGNECGGSSGWVNTIHYTYIASVADIIATNITTTPSTCEAPCDIAVSITWKNVGSVPGTFVPGYTVNDALYDDTTSITLNPGQTHVMSGTLYNLSTGSYVICPSPN